MTTGAHFGPPEPAPPAAGDAGANFLSNLSGDALTDTAKAQQISAGGQQLKDLASSGGFAISPEGFDAYSKICNNFLATYPDKRRNLRLLLVSAPMGSSEYAKQVANFNVTVASGDKQSLIPNLDLMKTGIESALEALEIARKNYREADEAHNQSFTKLNENP
jgi:hypothetical protein